MAGAIVKLDGFEFDRDEVAMLYHHSFYGTNDEQPLPAGHPPTPTMTAQLKLAAALGEDVPDAALQNVERAIADARARAQRRQAQRNEQDRAELQRKADAEAQRRRDAATQPATQPKPPQQSPKPPQSEA